MKLKNRTIIEITNAFVTAKQQAHNGGGMFLPANVAWKRRLNMKELFFVREIIIKAVKEDNNAVDEILSKETDVNIEMIKAEELGDCKVSEIEMDTLAFMIEQ